MEDGLREGGGGGWGEGVEAWGGEDQEEGGEREGPDVFQGGVVEGGGWDEGFGEGGGHVGEEGEEPEAELQGGGAAEGEGEVGEGGWRCVG